MKMTNILPLILHLMYIKSTDQPTEAWEQPLKPRGSVVSHVASGFGGQWNSLHVKI